MLLNAIDTTVISILYMEDNLADVELVRSTISKMPVSSKFTSIDSLDELPDHLSSANIIISDFNLQGFNGEDVLTAVREQNSKVPFIFFTSTIGDEKAVRLIKEGATDFVLKENIHRLPLVIERAIKETQLELETARIESQLKGQKNLLDTLFDSLDQVIFLKNKSGAITKINALFEQVFQTNSVNALGKKETDFIKSDLSLDQEVLELNQSVNTEISFIDHFGETKIFEVTKSPLIPNKVTEGVVVTMRDVTEKRSLEESRNRDQFLLQQAESQTKTGSFEFDVDNDILTVSPNFKRLVNLDIRQSHISFKKMLSLIHPDDRLIFTSKFNELIESQITFDWEHRYVITNQESGFGFCRTLIKPFSFNAEVLYYGTIQDITETRETSIALLNIQEEEREKISKELHDNIGQKLSAGSMFLDSERKDFKKAKRMIDESIVDIRSLSRLLTTSVLESHSFSESMEHLFENLPKRDLIHFESNLKDHEISDFVGGQLYRCIQEGVNNSLKYSNADEIKVKIETENKLLICEISDNGDGFDVDAVKLGNGLRNIKERVKNSHGQFDLDSEPQKGTKILIKIPLKHD